MLGGVDNTGLGDPTAYTGFFFAPKLGRRYEEVTLVPQENAWQNAQDVSTEKSSSLKVSELARTSDAAQGWRKGGTKTLASKMGGPADYLRPARSDQKLIKREEEEKRG